MGAGKTCAAGYLAETHGFQDVRYSRVLRHWVSTQEASRVELQSLGWAIMGGGRQAELNARLFADLDRRKSAAIDGLRHPTDFDCLSSALGSSFHLIFVRANPTIRFRRIRGRFATVAEFEVADKHLVESHIETLLPFSAAVVSNEGSLEHLYRELDRLVTAMRQGDQI